MRKTKIMKARKEKIQRIGILLVFFLFLATSIYSAVFTVEKENKTEQKSSTELTLVTEEDGNIKYSHYVNESGELTTASDKHYAEAIYTRNDQGKVIREEYLDEKGEPVIFSSGYSIVVREYIEDYTLFSYRDKDDNPVETANGYTYYKRYEYGNMKTDYYLDLQKRPVSCKSGYAIITRIYNENQKVTQEFYYNMDGKPIALADGQYGMAYDYDSQNRRIGSTFLGEDYEPLMSGKGYASKKLILNEDGTTAEEYYFDAQGTPCALGRGQHGVRYEGEQRVFLNADGSEHIALINILNNNQFLVIGMGIILIVVFFFISPNMKKILLALYILFILFETLITRETGFGSYQWIPFWSYRSFFSKSTIRTAILNNIWLFVPFGAGLSSIFRNHSICHGRRKALLITFCFSLTIELIQGIFGLGQFEVDDILNNTLGGLLGVLMTGTNIKKMQRELFWILMG